MEKSIEELLKESQEKRLRINEQIEKERNEKLRLRNLKEANKIISDWKKQFKRIRKSKIKISICSEYNSHFDRFLYKLRCFKDGYLIEIYNIEPIAGELLTENIEKVTHERWNYYTLYTNK